ncbi:hypothetical protein E2C01_048913 [Portunus trituberculatus]|uniref:Uncharacterized protein n=1 Tax=Portunus trituberculatus TaxID=210409 RepID=A0A5B7G7T4_PORTR|nr:hypothetical protein [Portunus trituberculatus]
MNLSTEIRLRISELHMVSDVARTNQEVLQMAGTTRELMTMEKRPLGLVSGEYFEKEWCGERLPLEWNQGDDKMIRVKKIDEAVEQAENMRVWHSTVANVN